MPLIVATPEKPRGSPGVALLDFDGDGDLDLYVTNGPGAANSLYANRLETTGALRFEDVAEAAGVAATDQDSTGVCFGDLDNDGDPDLIVLGRSEPNRLFENLGDGTFRDATAESRLGESDLGHTACSVGDVDGDGLLDLAVANSYDWSRREATLVEPWKDNHPNLLFVNESGLRFRDASASSGIRNLTGFQPPRDGAATITWALALVDYTRNGTGPAPGRRPGGPPPPEGAEPRADPGPEQRRHRPVHRRDRPGGHGPARHVLDGPRVRRLQLRRPHGLLRHEHGRLRLLGRGPALHPGAALLPGLPRKSEGASWTPGPGRSGPPPSAGR